MMKQSNRNRSMGRHARFNNSRHSNYTVTRNTTFDSSSPAGRVRGNSQQLIDKYLSLAKDARNQDDRVMYETYLQYADHYTRLLDLAIQNEQARVAISTATQTQQIPEVLELSDEVKEQAEQALAQVCEIDETVEKKDEDVALNETKKDCRKNNHFRHPRCQKKSEKTQTVLISNEMPVKETETEAAPQPVVIEIPD